MSKDASIGWMYDGAKGNVHREDYLLGKKVDKNFEKYSDVVNVQKAEAIDSIVGKRAVFNSGQVTGLKTSSLQKDIIKSEDPFVAVKVREETKRRELMDNPLMRMKLMNTLKDMMTSKKEKKKNKKSKKKKKRARSSSSSDSDSSDEKSKKKRSPSPKRKRRSSDRSEEPRSVRRRESSGDRRKEERTRRRSRSRTPETRKTSQQSSRKPRRDRSRSIEKSRDRSRSPRKHRSRSKSNERRRVSKSPKRHSSGNTASHHRHREEDKKTRPVSHSRSRSRSADKPSSSSKNYDSHVPRHLQNKRSSESESGDDRRSKRRNDDEDNTKKSYGLVEMRKRTAEEKEEDKAPHKEYKLLKIPTGRGSGNFNKKREPRRVLTDEEKAARLAEMQDNVKWRDEVREKNIVKGRAEDKEEEEEADKAGYAPSFIRSQMRDACDDMTMEKRLQSNKKGVQRAHGYMDRSFARK